MTGEPRMIERQTDRPIKINGNGMRANQKSDSRGTLLKGWTNRKSGKEELTDIPTATKVIEMGL